MVKLLNLVLLCAMGMYAQIDPTIPLRGKPVQVQDPMETYRRAQEIRNLQLQNEQIRLQNEALRRGSPESNAPSVPAVPPITPQPSAPRSQPSERTLGVLNGRFWLSVDATTRLSYLMGLSDAVAAIGKDDFKKLFFTGTATFGETCKFVDGFYEDPANAAIPVMDALVVFTAKLNGRMPGALEEMTAAFRHEFAKEVSPVAPSALSKQP